MGFMNNSGLLMLPDMVNDSKEEYSEEALQVLVTSSKGILTTLSKVFPHLEGLKLKDKKELLQKTANALSSIFKLKGRLIVKALRCS